MHNQMQALNSNLIRLIDITQLNHQENKQLLTNLTAKQDRVISLGSDIVSMNRQKINRKGSVSMQDRFCGDRVRDSLAIPRLQKKDTGRQT